MFGSSWNVELVRSSTGWRVSTRFLAWTTQFKTTVVQNIRKCHRLVAKLILEGDFASLCEKATRDEPRRHRQTLPPAAVPNEKQVIILSGNKLSGTLPQWLGELERLRHVDLSANLLEGPVPTALAELPYLEALLLQQNALEGVCASARQLCCQCSSTCR